ncbi:MAG: DUF1573 domain-containing protein [Candidatus Woesebacteria bacterium]
MSPKVIIISLLVFVVFVVGISFLFSTTQKPQSNAVAFSAQDTERPKAETALKFVDMGVIKVSDVKQQDYTLKNVGTKPLQILNINSSCGCTAGQIIYNGTTSKEYSMHAQSGFVTEIAPGDTATVRLTYRPATMPVYGAVEREVYVTTNDPANPKLIFSIKANVQ